MHVARRCDLRDWTLWTASTEFILHVPSIMGKGKQLRPDQIAVIGALCQAEKTNKQIRDITGISLRTIQTWTKKFRDTNGNLELQRQ